MKEHVRVRAARRLACAVMSVMAAIGLAACEDVSHTDRFSTEHGLPAAAARRLAPEDEPVATASCLAPEDEPGMMRFAEAMHSLEELYLLARGRKLMIQAAPILYEAVPETAVRARTRLSLVYRDGLPLARLDQWDPHTSSYVSLCEQPFGYDSVMGRWRPDPSFCYSEDSPSCDRNRQIDHGVWLSPFASPFMFFIGYDHDRNSESPGILYLETVETR
jgi:hypothetical protein